MLKWAPAAVLVLVVAAQLVRPARTNPATDPAKTLEAHTQVTPEAAAILKRACADCHSHDTAWPWYTNVAPISWFVIDHVNSGRRHLNFSDWTQPNGRRATRSPDGQFDAICRAVENDDMPLWTYLLIHRDAKLTEADRRTLCDWTKTAPRGK
jgi:hypothetical protein